MRSAGFILDATGRVKRTWVFQTPDSGYEQAPLPVEDGDEVVLIDLSHPAIPPEPPLHECRSRGDVFRAYPSEARQHKKCHIPADGKARRISPQLTMLKQRTAGDDTEYEKAKGSEVQEVREKK